MLTFSLLHCNLSSSKLSPLNQVTRIVLLLCRVQHGLILRAPLLYLRGVVKCPQTAHSSLTSFTKQSRVCYFSLFDFYFYNHVAPTTAMPSSQIVQGMIMTIR